MLLILFTIIPAFFAILINKYISYPHHLPETKFVVILSSFIPIIILLLLCGSLLGLVLRDIWKSQILLIATALGLIFGLFLGGKNIYNPIFRWSLWRAGSIPWNYEQFLNFAADRILLRKIGNDYIFVHRLLLDYFATLDTFPISEGETSKHLLPFKQ